MIYLPPLKYLTFTRPPGVYPRNIPIADFVSLVAKYMHDEGNDVKLVFFHRKPFPEEVRWLGENGLKWRVWADTHYFTRSPKHFIDLFRILKEEKPDIVEFEGPSVPFGIIAAKAAGIRNRVVWHTTLAARDFFSLSKTIRTKIQDVRASLYYRLSSLVIANSNECKRENISLYKTPESKIHTHYLGIHLPEPGESIARERNSLVCISRLIKPKGIHFLIEALPAVAARFPDLRLYLIGAGDQTWVKALASSLGVEKNLVFTGEVSREKIYEYLRRASVAVFPTLAEALGLVAAEAQACGTPLIAARTGGLKEVVEDGVSGILVEPGNSAEIRDAIIRLLSDEQLRTELSSAGIRRAQYFEIHERARSYAKWLTSKIGEPSEN